jgi:hypothetical protein
MGVLMGVPMGTPPSTGIWVAGAGGGEETWSLGSREEGGGGDEDGEAVGVGEAVGAGVGVGEGALSDPAPALGPAPLGGGVDTGKEAGGGLVSTVVLVPLTMRRVPFTLRTPMVALVMTVPFLRARPGQVGVSGVSHQGVGGATQAVQVQRVPQPYASFGMDDTASSGGWWLCLSHTACFHRLTQCVLATVCLLLCACYCVLATVCLLLCACYCVLLLCLCSCCCLTWSG